MSDTGTKKKKKGMQKMAHTGPNMTPMVDIVMCILIFFMLGSTFLAPELYLTNSMPAISKHGLGTIEGNTKLPSVRNIITIKVKDQDVWVTAFEKMWKITTVKSKDKGYTDADVADSEKNRKEDLVNLAASFRERTAGMTNDVQFIIAPERNVSYQDVISVYDTCMKAKMTQVAFAPAK